MGKQLLAGILAMTLLTACGEESKSPGDHSLGGNCSLSFVNIDDVRGLAFAAVSGGYSSSNLYFLDYETGCIRTLLTGQSGDPMVTKLGANLILANRSISDSNFVSLLDEGGQFLSQPQISNPLPGFGDPSAILALDEEQILLLARTQGLIGVLDLRTGELLQSLDPSAWEKDDKAFYPNAVFRGRNGDDHLIFVVHAHFDGYGDERLFAIKKHTDGSLEALDLDPADSAVGGLRYQYINNPSRVLYSDEEHPLIISLCTHYASPGCKGGVEKFDPETLTLKKLMSFDKIAEAQFDAIEAGNGEFFLRISNKEGAKRRIIKVDPKTESFEEIHSYAADTDGESLMLYEPLHKTLIIGEGFGDDRGRLLIYQAQGSTYALDAAYNILGMPYNAVFLY